MPLDYLFGQTFKYQTKILLPEGGKLRKETSDTLKNVFMKLIFL